MGNNACYGCLNFIKLCKLKYYNYCLFHSVEENYVAQTGDPTGTGRGGVSVFGRLFGSQADYFDMETTPKLRHTRRGLVSFVNNGQDMHGSQFFITLADDLDYLDSTYTVFGQIGEGLEIVDKLNETICDESKRPYKDVRITHTSILDDPFDDPEGLGAVPSRSPSPSAALLKDVRIAVDEDVDPDNQGRTAEQIEEDIEINDATAHAHILEMVGDIHHAEEKPPDNVLFVCKLNAVTTSDDLNIIFSRFGKIKSCEVIMDKKNNHSLQYAFIEFDDPAHCENAYFKMDNVLIDDRRIHVDFSQSVAKNTEYQIPSSLAAKIRPPSKQQSSKDQDIQKIKREDRSRDLKSDNRREHERGHRREEERDRRKDASSVSASNGRDKRRRDDDPQRTSRGSPSERRHTKEERSATNRSRDRSDSRRHRSRSRSRDKKRR